MTRAGKRGVVLGGEEGVFGSLFCWSFFFLFFFFLVFIVIKTSAFCTGIFFDGACGSCNVLGVLLLERALDGTQTPEDVLEVALHLAVQLGVSLQLAAHLCQLLAVLVVERTQHCCAALQFVDSEEVIVSAECNRVKKKGCV